MAKNELQILRALNPQASKEQLQTQLETTLQNLRQEVNDDEQTQTVEMTQTQPTARDVADVLQGLTWYLRNGVEEYKQQQRLREEQEEEAKKRREDQEKKVDAVSRGGDGGVIDPRAEELLSSAQELLAQVKENGRLDRQLVGKAIGQITELIRDYPQVRDWAENAFGADQVSRLMETGNDRNVANNPDRLREGASMIKNIINEHPWAERMLKGAIGGATVDAVKDVMNRAAEGKNVYREEQQTAQQTAEDTQAATRPSTSPSMSFRPAGMK